MTDFAQDDSVMHWGGVAYKTILGSDQTGGALSIVDVLSPLGSGPPRHVHHAEDEIFVILTGQCRFWLEGEEFLRGPGETAMVPRGLEHTFKVIGDQPCRHLVILTPGGFENFFADMARGQFAIPADMPAIVDSATRHSLSFTGPPLE